MKGFFRGDFREIVWQKVVIRLDQLRNRSLRVKFLMTYRGLFHLNHSAPLEAQYHTAHLFRLKILSIDFNDTSLLIHKTKKFKKKVKMFQTKQIITCKLGIKLGKC